jgi:hypothetical protein
MHSASIQRQQVLSRQTFINGLQDSLNLNHTAFEIFLPFVVDALKKRNIRVIQWSVYSYASLEHMIWDILSKYNMYTPFHSIKTYTLLTGNDAFAQLTEAQLELLVDQNKNLFNSN